MGEHVGLLDHREGVGRRQHARVVDGEHVAVLEQHVVLHARRGHDEVDLVLAPEPLLDDLHVQEAEVAAAEAETQRLRRLRLVGEGAVVQAQLLERVAGVLVIR